MLANPFLGQIPIFSNTSITDVFFLKKKEDKDKKPSLINYSAHKSC